MKRNALPAAVSPSGPGAALHHRVMGACAAGLKLNQHFLRWLEQAQLTELQATHDWSEALRTAAERIAHATSLDELVAAQSTLFAAALSQATNGRGLALASWIELQAALAEALQSQTNDAVGAMSVPLGDGAAAASMSSWPMATLLDQTRAALGAMTDSWMAAMQEPAAYGVSRPERSI